VSFVYVVGGKAAAVMLSLKEASLEEDRRNAEMNVNVDWNEIKLRLIIAIGMVFVLPLLIIAPLIMDRIHISIPAIGMIAALIALFIVSSYTYKEWRRGTL
jgi:hypothetical protein